MLLLIVTLPLVSAAIGLLLRGDSWARLGPATNVVVLVLGGVLAVRVLDHQVLTGGGGLLRADGLSTFMVVVIGAVATIATVAGRSYAGLGPGGHLASSKATLEYRTLVQIFVSMMLLAVLSANVGVMWVAVEATTITTTFLVGAKGTRHALEASWKYAIICSVGIALAFMGTILFYLAVSHLGLGHGFASLDWTTLERAGRRLNPNVVRLAFALILLGYGAKAGLIPMHSWLPDAHGQAPPPMSALMSGVLLSVAFYAILRFRMVTSLSVGVGYPRDLLVGIGLLSMGLAATLMVTQRDLKRLLAYSSMEHMALLALAAAAATPLAVAGLLLHILGHALTKSSLFVSAGAVVELEATSEIKALRHLLGRRPKLGGTLLVGLIAIMGLPPFSLFVSEVAMFKGEFSAGLGWAASIAMVLLVVASGSIALHARGMFLGDDAHDVRPEPIERGIDRTVAVALAVCAALGLAAWPMAHFIALASHGVIA